jgi:hypothetical protein
MRRAFLQSALWGVLACSQLAGFVPLSFASDPPDTGMYVDAIRAINEGRWKDAQKLFSILGVQQPEFADGALYWQAYAQNKLGEVKTALESCDKLRHTFPFSKWIDECGALQIEIQSKTGNPLSPSAWTDDDLKLLAIASLMRTDEPKALADLQEILNGDGSEDLKKRAMFILGNHYSDETYAQIVRVRYVEGDVRVARGEREEKLAGQDWEQAVADLPLETGFSLVTGNGRAEIELEDASTLYLGENSVLLCNDLHTTAGIPYTEMALLSGTVSLAIKPYIPGEQLILRTPTDNITVKYPQGASFRVNSYTDGTMLTKQDAVAWHLTNSGEQIGDAKTVTLRGGHVVTGIAAEDAASYADFDKWVAGRVAQRAAAMTEVMKAAGLTTPLPGLADMKGQGEFFACPPYGTCWEPAGAEESQQAKIETSLGRGEPRIVRASFTTPIFRSAQILDPFDATVGGPLDAFSPCFPSSLLYRTQRDPITGKMRVVNSGLGFTAPWGWAVCHAGGWVPQRRHHRYAWCVNQKRHHIAPVRWVKSDHKVGFVPLHPFDVKGKPPINRAGEVFVVTDKHGLSVERGRFEGGHPISVLNEPPHELRTSYLRPLAPVNAPHMEIHAMRGPGGGEKVTSIKPVSTPLRFDSKSQSFMMPREIIHGGKPGYAPISNHGGTLQARGESFAGSHSGGFSGGGMHGGGGSSGGGSHGGSSGGGGGGGGSHGGGGSSGGGSSGGGSSGGSAGGGGGGHH